MKKLSQILTSILILGLFSISYQQFLRKTLDEEPLSICLPIDSSVPNTGGPTIICSEKICHGTIPGNENNTFTNVTLECNSKGCIIKNKPREENQCNTEKECQNCIEMTLTCFNEYCVGGRPSNNDRHNENNNNNNEDNKKSDDSQNDNHNGNDSSDDANNDRNKETDKNEENNIDNAEKSFQ